MGTQASKLPRRSRSALRVVGGVLGAMAREVVAYPCCGPYEEARERLVDGRSPGTAACPDPAAVCDSPVLTSAVNHHGPSPGEVQIG
jgi:hypothetical protein